MPAHSLNVYHRRSPHFRGTTLYPLNRLAQVAPDLYDEQRAKYAGRETIMQQRVPPLDCLWNDVIHLSPVHPKQVADLARAEGLPWFEADWFAIDPRSAGFSSSDTAIFRYEDMGSSPSIADEEFVGFSMASLAELTDVPQRTRAYYASVPKTRNYFIFAGVPHILHRGTIDVGGCEIIRA